MYESLPSEALLADRESSRCIMSLLQLWYPTFLCDMSLFLLFILGLSSASLVTITVLVFSSKLVFGIGSVSELYVITGACRRARV